MSSGVVWNIKRMLVAYTLISLTVGCAALTSLATDALTGKKGGISTELVVGDKEQVLGTNLDVKAESVGKVVGTSDNSVSAPSAKEIKVTNNTLPWWVVGLFIILSSLVGWLLPRPKAWKRLISKDTKEN